MLIPFLNKILRKAYKIWISSIKIILENEENEDSCTIKPSLSSQKSFIYPETVIMDLSRPIINKKEDEEEDDYSIV
jgi:hypothetical protein